mgnify:CR=1 FL=1
MFDVIAFDADDTLWHNESIFIMIQKRFCEMLSSHKPSFVRNTLSKIHIRNLKHFGYGIKGFVLSMIETFLVLTDGKVKGSEIQMILKYGKEMLESPIELLPNVIDVLKDLSQNFPLLLITKGDLIDQERKISQSGLIDFFEEVEIVSDKTELTYEKILTRNNIEYSKFLMIGNSMRSDIVPVVKIGGNAVHIPYLTTWEHEKDHPHVDLDKYSVLKHIGLLPEFIRSKKWHHRL